MITTHTHTTMPESGETPMGVAQDDDVSRRHYGEEDALLGLGSYGLRVYHIDDGERYHYVARSAWEALRVHSVDHECESVNNPGEDVTVTLVKPDEVLTIAQEDVPAEGEFPPSFTLTPGDERTTMTLAATAADWAWHERASVALRGAAQISASVW